MYQHTDTVKLGLVNPNQSSFYNGWPLGQVDCCSDHNELSTMTTIKMPPHVTNSSSVQYTAPTTSISCSQTKPINLGKPSWLPQSSLASYRDLGKDKGSSNGEMRECKKAVDNHAEDDSWHESVDGGESLMLPPEMSEYPASFWL